MAHAFTLVCSVIVFLQDSWKFGAMQRKVPKKVENIVLKKLTVFYLGKFRPNVHFSHSARGASGAEKMYSRNFSRSPRCIWTKTHFCNKMWGMTSKYRTTTALCTRDEIFQELSLFTWSFKLCKPSSRFLGCCTFFKMSLFAAGKKPQKQLWKNRKFTTTPLVKCSRLIFVTFQFVVMCF